MRDLNTTVIEKAIVYIKELFANNSDGHDADHSLRVYQNALALSESHPECDLESVELAALLHDVDDHKLFDTKNNDNARRFLMEQEIEPERIEHIITCINSVSFSQNKGKRPETLDAQIVQDADRLDAIGAIGIARTFAYGGKHDRALLDSVEHFHEKLLKLQDLMNTEGGRRLAGKRHDFMVAFLKELDEELGETR